MVYPEAIIKLKWWEKLILYFKPCYISTDRDHTGELVTVVFKKWKGQNICTEVITEEEKSK